MNIEIEQLAPAFEKLLGLKFSDSTGEAEQECSDSSDQDVETEEMIVGEEEVVEEGEIVEKMDVQVRVGTKKTKAKNDRRRKKAVARQEEREQQRQKEWSIRADEQKLTIAMLLGEDVHRVHVHNLSYNSNYLAQIQSLEVKHNSPLSSYDVEFQCLNTEWIHDPGVHIGIRQARRQIIFMLRITSWEEMPSQLRQDTQANLQTLMDWSTCVHVIKNNSAQNRPQAFVDRRTEIHGEHMSVKTTKKLYGNMYGVGWHQSMESGKTLAYYAPNSCSNDIIERYEELLHKLPAVADMFKTRFCYLFPAGAKSLIETSREGNIPSFDDFLDGDSKTHPFSNCLTLTNNDFANFQHRDKDHIAVAFGLWWTSARALNSDGQPFYSFTTGLDQGEIDGGEFLWGEYGIGVNFQRAQGLVEIFWRGKHDFHSTMLSSSPEGATRWGTSVQLTQRGVNAVSKFWELGKFERAFTPQERVCEAQKKVGGTLLLQQLHPYLHDMEMNKSHTKKNTLPRKDKAEAAWMKQMQPSSSRESSVGPSRGSSRLRKSRCA